jgi:hypothetical protein
MRVSAADHERKHRKLQRFGALLALLQQHGVDVPFDVVDGDQRLIERPR